MRCSPSYLITVALTVGTLFSSPVAQAQQAATPAPAAMAPSPLTAPPAAPLEIAALTIPTPPGAKLRVEMDARSEDLLGMVKAFLTGIGETGTPSAKTPGQPPPPPNPIADVLQAGNLAEVLKDVNHVHFVVWELPPSPALITPPADVPAPAAPGMPAKPHAKPATLTPTTLPVASVLPTPDATISKFDSNAFYEEAFSREGAHRILFTDADEYKLVMVGFPDKRGFAFAVSGGGYVGVSRSDGYPNLEALSSFISHITTAVFNSKTAKKLMDAGINSTVGTGDKGDAHGAGGEDKK